jgi:transposase
MAAALAVPRLQPAQPRTNAYCHEEREPIFHDYYKSRSLRSLSCTLGVSKNTVSAWIKESERAARILRDAFSRGPLDGLSSSA